MDAQQRRSSLDEYVDMRTLLPYVQKTFLTFDALRWFVRHHRSELAEAGAMIRIGRQPRIHPALFDQAALAIGRKATALVDIER